MSEPKSDVTVTTGTTTTASTDTPTTTAAKSAEASKVDQDNDALIARLLMEDQQSFDNPYYENRYSNARERNANRAAAPRDEDDDEYVPTLGGPIKKKNGDLPKKRKSDKVTTSTAPGAASPTSTPSTADNKDTNKKPRQQDDAEYDGDKDKSNKKEKKPKKEKDPSIQTGKWTPEEETKFLEGLALHGRDWKKLQEHVVTRDRAGVISHAQKHFIKLFINGEPLPPKVKESGEGYTLSGKELDPNSAAAKPYFTGKKGKEKMQQILASKASPDGSLLSSTPSPSSTTAPTNTNSTTTSPSTPLHATTNNNSTTTTSPSSSQPPQSPSSTTTNTATATATPSTTPMSPIKSPKSTSNGHSKEHDKPKSTPKSPKPPKSPSKPQLRKRKPAPEEGLARVEYDESGRTEYSKHRLRSTQPNSFRVLFEGDMGSSDELNMVVCASWGDGEQPFRVLVSSNVLLLADFHAHLQNHEIIGFLAGQWDPVKKVITILEAFPCKSINTGSDERKTVEMDPESELQVREDIQELDMTVVGWYHSHPHFEPDPSLVDIQNQFNYQTLFRDNKNKTDPFVGMIVGSYDTRLLNEESAVNWFHVISKPKPMPMFVTHEIMEQTQVPDTVFRRMVNLIETHKSSPTRVNFQEIWRYLPAPDTTTTTTATTDSSTPPTVVSTTEMPITTQPNDNEKSTPMEITTTTTDTTAADNTTSTTNDTATTTDTTTDATTTPSTTSTATPSTTITPSNTASTTTPATTITPSSSTATTTPSSTTVTKPMLVACTKLEKLRKSLESRLPKLDRQASDRLLDSLLDILRKSWFDAKFQSS